MNNRHLYHLVDRSPWPLFVSFGVLFITSGLILYMNRITNGFFVILLGLIVLIGSLFFWFRDIISESTYQGNHTVIVQKGLKIGFILFIGSEVVFFGGFFWAFFHSGLSPSIVLGLCWPPINIIPLNPWGIPMLNTAILLLSGISITWVHFGIISRRFNYVLYGFIVTLVLALVFTLLQIGEYLNAPFNITDSVFGSAFYSLTGLHGLHVIIGSIFIFVCFIRFVKYHFTNRHHLGFEFASWYWHFVDVVWLFLYVFVYIWGGL
jgi:cytochrome c oxidase subunit 3